MNTTKRNIKKKVRNPNSKRRNRNFQHDEATIVLTVDGIVRDRRGRVLLIQRAHQPFSGQWVLPGGRVEYGETVENAVVREVREETGVQARVENLLRVYSKPNRDPRFQGVSVTFILRWRSGKARSTPEAFQSTFFSLDALPKKLGFDHRRILSDYRRSLQK